MVGRRVQGRGRLGRGMGGEVWEGGVREEGEDGWGVK